MLTMPTDAEVQADQQRVDTLQTAAFQEWLDRPEIQFILNTSLNDDETRRRAIVVASSAFRLAFSEGFAAGSATVVRKLTEAMSKRFPE